MYSGSERRTQRHRPFTLRRRGTQIQRLCRFHFFLLLLNIHRCLDTHRQQCPDRVSACQLHCLSSCRALQRVSFAGSSIIKPEIDTTSESIATSSWASHSFYFFCLCSISFFFSSGTLAITIVDLLVLFVRLIG